MTRNKTQPTKNLNCRLKLKRDTRPATETKTQLTNEHDDLLYEKLQVLHEMAAQTGNQLTDSTRAEYLNTRLELRTRRGNLFNANSIAKLRQRLKKRNIRL